MEKEKVKNTKKNQTKNKKTVKETNNKNKKTKKRGFTLIELLAVIIILGVLMIIAIPSVTTYISNSRKSAYVNTAKEVISGARTLVNSGKIELFDTDTTYYISNECIQTENKAESPYGKFTKAYVIVTYDGNGFDYFWASLDESGQGIKKITKVDNLDIDDLESNLKGEDIPDSYGIDGRNNYMIIDKQNTNCKVGEKKEVSGIINSDTGELDPDSIKYACEPGTYLVQATQTCANCHPGHYCPGGKYPYNDTKDQGIDLCATGSYSPEKSSSCTACTNGKTSYYYHSNYNNNPYYSSSCGNTCTNSFGATSWKSTSWTPNEVNNVCAIDSCKTVSGGTFTLRNNVCVYNGTLYIYTDSSSKEIGVGKDISTLALYSAQTYFNSSELEKVTKYVHIKANVNDNVITSYDLCFRINGNGIRVSGGRSGDYCFKIPFNNNTNETYQYNVNVLKTIFGANNTRCIEDSNGYKCSLNSTNFGYRFEVLKNGEVSVYHDDDDYETNNGISGNPYCVVDVNRIAKCPTSSCLSGDTLIDVYDKKKKRKYRKKLRDITPDDLILCWDFNTSSFAYVEPLWIKKLEIEKRYYLLEFSDGSSLEIVGDHKVFDVDRNKFVNAGNENELNIGSHVYNSNGEIVELTSWKEIEEEIDSHNVITNYHMNMFANGILTSCVFSNIYNIENMKYVDQRIERITNEDLEGIDEKYIKGLRLNEVPSNFRDNKETTISYINDYVNNLKAKENE